MQSMSATQRGRTNRSKPSLSGGRSALGSARAWNGSTERAPGSGCREPGARHGGARRHADVPPAEDRRLSSCAMDPRSASPRRAPSPDRDMIHEALRGISTGHMTFLATRNGRTRSAKAMGHVIAAAAADAGFDRSAHGLRKSGAVALAEGGANPLQIGAWTGHHSLSEVAHYTEEADRKRVVMGTEQDRNPVNRPKPAIN